MEAETIVIHLPLKPLRQAGRKYLISPEGDTVPTKRPEPKQNTMQRAIVRAFLWRKKIEAGKFNGIADLARKKNVTEGYVQRQLNLTCLAPTLVAEILSNDQPRYMSLQHLYELPALLWVDQIKSAV